MAERFKIGVAIYIAFIKDNKVLLSLRQNTRFEDGKYGVVQGHVDAEDKTVKDTAIREAMEEVGVLVEPEHMELAIVGHQQIFAPYVDFFYVCRHWQGDIVNKEADKCRRLEWFELEQLPKNIIGHVAEYLKRMNSELQMIEL